MQISHRCWESGHGFELENGEAWFKPVLNMHMPLPPTVTSICLPCKLSCHKN